MRTLLAILLLSVSAQASYQNTEIVKVVQLKENGTVCGFRVHYVVNDSAFPPVSPGLSNPSDPNSSTLPAVSPLNGQIVIRGANYDSVKALSGAARRTFIWNLIRPDVKHLYRKIAAPVETEETDQSSPINGVLSTQTP